MCIVGVSKNLCGGGLSGGNWSPFRCIGPNQVQCNTLKGTGVAFGTPLRTDGNSCDEARELDGNLRNVINVNVRQHPSLRGEGSIKGTFDLLRQGSVIAQGQINGTLGVSTHRKSCDGQCGKDCERCHAAFFDATQGLWTIHSEGFMDGRISEGRSKGCQIRWSYQGQFTAKGTASGPTAPGNEWKFCGTLNGVLECPC